MALDLDAGYVAPGLGAGNGVETTLPIFNVERVQLQFRQCRWETEPVDGAVPIP